MAKEKTIYTCQKCGSQSPKWMGKCLDCGEWNSFVEETFSAGGLSTMGTAKNFTPPRPLTEINEQEGKHEPTGIPELDRVLGGGLVPGSAILIGGEPGIGKSTLLLETLGKIAAGGKKVLYVTGEESAAQIKMRASRLKIAEERLLIATENCLEQILALLASEKPKVIAIDSVQTIYSQNLASSPGTVSQIRESSGRLINEAKSRNIVCLLVGHVTKEGAIAGPKVLEHMVDCVLYFETDQGHTFRILRAVKNRYGTTNEIGVFEMTGEGLKNIANPSQMFLADRSLKGCGSAVIAAMEGTRPLLLEVQALVSASGFANPRRTALGVDSSRISLLVAVMEKIVGLHLTDQDIFVNIAGGLKVEEPAGDLGTAAAIFSSFRNIPLDPKAIFLGEIGLTGEIRAVSRIEARLQEAAKLGFARAFLPKGNVSKEKPKGLELVPVQNIGDFLQFLA